MKRLATILAASTFCVAAFAGQTTEKVDAAAIAKIRDEGLNRSQVMETMFWLTDRYGPRLTGSPGFVQAGDWAVKQLTAWGVANAHKELFPFGRAWTLVKFHATMTEPQVMPIIGAVKAWTPGTNGTFTTDAVRLQIGNEADCRSYQGRLAGKVVLTQPTRDVAMLEKGDGTVLRYADQDGKWLKEAETLPPPRGRGAGGGGGRAGGGGGGRGAGGAAAAAAALAAMTPDQLCKAIGTAATAAAAAAARGRGAATPPNDPAVTDPTPAPTPAGPGNAGPSLAQLMNRFYKMEGVLALFDRGGNSDMAAGGSDLTWQQQHPDGGTFAVQSGGSPSDAVDANLPQVVLAVEHYNRMVRLAEHGVPVKIELNIETKFFEETQPNGSNIVAEIPGGDLADQIVLIGGHFDSWQGATGATDNAAGSAAMMEVLRIIKATGLKPRRTIRIGLWGAEEGGLLGSRAYVRDHLGTAAEPKPELAKLSAYFNLDNGTGPIRGIWMQNNPLVAPIFAAWSAPLKDLGVEIMGPRSVTSTDHTNFDGVGVPAFQFVQERYEYNSRTHHTNMDFLDRVQADDLKQIATVAAVFAWQAANRDDMLPRKPPAAGRGGNR